jgi:putative isomerase
MAMTRAWNTWNSDVPAQMVYLPLGLRVTPLAYAASRNSVTAFAPGENVKLGPRRIDAGRVELELNHCGTELHWRYDKPDDFSLHGTWRSGSLGEWGLRFWIILCFSSDNNASWYYDTDSGLLTTRSGHRHICVRCRAQPLLATFHDSQQALSAELTDKGYFYLDSRGTQGRFAALRFNLEEMPDNDFVVSMADSALLASSRAYRLLADNDGATADRLSELPEQPQALAAIRDVVAWNTVWDPINRRPYTALSRNWNSHKFGGFGVWLDDVFYHALLAGLLDPQLARENLSAVLAGATPQGNLPCLLTGNDAWVDRSQPPIGSFIVWLLYLRSGERSLLEPAYPILKRNHDWWWHERDGNGDGLVEYGTSDVGEGLYIGTRLAARDESSMDNSPVHDEAGLDPHSRTLNSADVGLNSLLALDGDMLALIAATLGDTATAAELRARSQQLKTRIREQLWDDERGVFANRLWSGRFVRSLAPTSFYPLLAGAASTAQAQGLIEHYLLHPQRFGGDWWLPAVTRDDPAFADNVYWRGRIWPPLNFLCYYGLRRYGYDDIAGQLAANGYRLFERAWQQRHCPENFNADSGEALDQPDTDSFYGWGALMPYLALAETIDFDPWRGWTLHNTGTAIRIGPLLTAAGRAVVECRDGILMLTLDEVPVLRTDIRGRLQQLCFSPGRIALTLPAGAAAGGLLEFPTVAAQTVVHVSVAGQPISYQPRAGGISLQLASTLTEAAELLLVWTIRA